MIKRIIPVLMLGILTGCTTAPDDTFDPPILQVPTERLNHYLYFDFDSASLTDQATQILAQHAQYLLNHPDTHVALIGRTDTSGEHYYNLDLGAQRADQAKKFLVSEGIEAKRIQTVSMGPIQDRAYQDASMQRRVTIVY